MGVGFAGKVFIDRMDCMARGEVPSGSIFWEKFRDYPFVIGGRCSLEDGMDQTGGKSKILY